MENSINERILHDYRKTIVGDTWGDWVDLNILEITLKYELSKFKHIEGYKDVKRDAFSSYCEEYDKEYKTSDIMNGWWGCFKELFDIKYRRDKQRNPNPKIEELCEDTGKKQDDLVKLLENNLNEKYKNKMDFNKEEACKALMRLLKVVYTVGNMTPAYENKNRSKLDNWEVKYLIQKQNFENNNSANLHFEDYSFEDYCEDGEIKKTKSFEEFEKNPAEYMNKRVELILKRGYRIVNDGKPITPAELEELKKCIDEELGF